MAAPQVEFFFDCSSPWTYLAFTRIEALCARHGAELIWRPILVGGVFNEVNKGVYAERAAPVPAKARYYQKDLGDWARLHGITIGKPSIFPVRAVRAQRACLYARRAGRLPQFARAVFHAYWGEDRDISSAPVLQELGEAAGLPAQGLAEALEADVFKQELRRETDELIARGGFGSPTMFLNRTDMYFGNDRLPLLDAALARLKAKPA